MCKIKNDFRLLDDGPTPEPEFFRVVDVGGRRCGFVLSPTGKRMQQVCKFVFSCVF